MTLWALLSGLSLGLLGLPSIWAVWGLSWPFFFAKAFSRPPGLGPLLLFGLGLAQGQFGWLLSALQPASGRPAWLDWLLVSLGGLAVFLPWLLLLWGWAWLCRRQARWAPEPLFLAGFGPLYLFFLLLRDSLPSLSLIAATPAALPGVLDLLGPGYRVWGVKGIELLLLLTGLALAGVIQQKRWPSVGWALVPLGLAALPLLLAPPPSPAGQELTAAYLPWRGSLGTDPARERALADLLVRGPRFDSADLILWPESALPGPVAQGKALERLQQTLAPGQALLFGANRQEPSAWANAAYLLRAGPFDYSFYAKQYPVPLVERQWGEIPLLLPRELTYRPGEARLFSIKGVELAPGICSEQFLDAWYRQREDRAQGYVFLSRWFLFGPLGRAVLQNLGRAFALQTDKPVLLAVNGGLSGPVEPLAKQQGQGSWNPQALGGQALVIASDSVSPYFAFGRWLLAGVSVVLSAGFLLGARPTPEAPRADHDGATANNRPTS